MNEEATKYDEGKLPIGLVPFSAIKGIAQALNLGCKKYGKHNWRKGLEWSRCYDATLRHLWAFIDGEDLDESGLCHIDHALCELAFLKEMVEKRKDLDDRHKSVVSLVEVSNEYVKEF